MVEGNGIPSKIKSALAQCRDSHEIIQLETAKIDQFQDKLSHKLDGYHGILNGVTKQLNKIRSLQHLVEYFKILKDIQEVRLVFLFFFSLSCFCFQCSFILNAIWLLFKRNYYMSQGELLIFHIAAKVYQPVLKMIKNPSDYTFRCMVVAIRRTASSDG